MAKIYIDKLGGTEFEKRVWRALTHIRRGTTITYKELAKKIGKPKAIRAVANAVGKNPLAPAVPCHRVIRSDGSLGGYSGRGGVKTKRALLAREGVSIKNEYAVSLKKLGVLLVLAGILFVDFKPFEAVASHRSGYSSALLSSIRELDDDRVENVPLPILFGLTPDNISPNFGDPRSDGRLHEGLDIMAPKGAPIVSPTPAVVIRTGEGDSAGNYVYTANPGGETFAYFHLDSIADIDRGDELKKGDLIGYVGNTGNASATAPHLHFEIQDGEPLDPYPRIKSIFPLADKMKYVDKILNNADDEKEFAELMVKMYRKEFMLANTLGIFVPAPIQTALLTVPISASISNDPNIPGGDLKLGSQGPLVVALQEFLLTKNAGLFNGVVADGYFGLSTQKALIDYQAAVGITPAAGYYGPITRAYIAAHP